MTDYKTIAESNRFIVLDKYQREWKVAETCQSEDSLERELIEDLVNRMRNCALNRHSQKQRVSPG